jgi:serine/threonine-protein kinase
MELANDSGLAPGSILGPFEIEGLHLVAVQETGDADGLRYIASDYIDGVSLRERLERDGPLPIPQFQRLARHLAAALDALHGAGLVHRDVKPSNVILDPGGAAWRPS